MKIAQISPLYESVPPKLYGGTERVVSYLSDSLTQAGHEVTLFASGDSQTDANLIPICERALRLDEACNDQLAYHFLELQEVIERAGDFDFIHFHIDYLHFPFSHRLNVPFATTLHGRLDLPETGMLLKKFNTQPLISISDSQRKPVPDANWVGNVYHGLPEKLLEYRNGDGGYLACLGRVSPEKGMDIAIAMAVESGIPLKIAAKVDKVDQEYFDQVINPLLDQPGVEFIGEINESQKQDFLGGAIGLLFPIEWPEPFGLVMIEAMACGTPVIAFRNGSVAEVMTNGLTGFIVDNPKEGIEAIGKIGDLDRRVVRRMFENRYSATRMAEDYVSLYTKLATAKSVNILSKQGGRSFQKIG